MRALAEGPAHSRGQTYAGLAELISQAIRRSQGISPSLLAVTVEQIDLRGRIGE